MKREFVYSFGFEKQWEDLKLSEDALKDLEDYLLENSHLGDIVKGSGGLRKIRWSLPDKGKSGGIRVLYLDFIFYEKIYMLDVYAKNEKENITDSQRNDMRKLIKALEKELRDNV